MVRATYGGLGFVAGAAAARLYDARSTAAPTSLSGLYTLDSGNESRSGMLCYEPDGRVSCQTVQQAAHGQPISFTGFSGRWWVHNRKTSFAATYPPHDGTLVEHDVTAASDPSLVGKSQVQRYALSPDGTLLTLSVVELRDGESKCTQASQWRRVMTA
jgi:hypothetical protein